MRMVVLCCLIAAPLFAGAAMAQDSARSAPGAPALRRQIEERFAARIQERLGLSNEQMTKLRATTTKFGGRRRELEGRQMELRRALGLQLRPGATASKDSVARLTDELMAGRVAYAQTFNDELAELKTYLDPVQRAQLMVMRERLLRAAKELRERRRDDAGGLRGRRRLFMDR